MPATALPPLLDLIGIAVFALTGALLAPRMRPVLYVTAAALAAALCAGADWLGLPRQIAWPIAALAGFSLRGAAIHFAIGLPAYERTKPD